MIDIKGIDKAALLAALHNAAVPQGMGWLHAGPDLTADQVRAEYEATPDTWRASFYFPDYYHGRPIKTDLRSDTMDPRLFDRDAGIGTAASVVAALRSAP